MIATDLIEVAYTNVKLLDIKNSELAAGCYILAHLIESHKRSIFSLDFNDRSKIDKIISKIWTQ